LDPRPSFFEKSLGIQKTLIGQKLRFWQGIEKGSLPQEAEESLLLSTRLWGVVHNRGGRCPRPPPKTFLKNGFGFEKR
jgi:hypothetical protein